MRAKRSIGGVGRGRMLVRIVALAAALAFGSFAAADPVGATGAASCGVAAPAASVATGIEWASSASMPGLPY